MFLSYEQQEQKQDYLYALNEMKKNAYNYYGYLTWEFNNSHRYKNHHIHNSL
jgi:hypothetical protein